MKLAQAVLLSLAILHFAVGDETSCDMPSDEEIVEMIGKRLNAQIISWTKTSSPREISSSRKVKDEDNQLVSYPQRRDVERYFIKTRLAHRANVTTKPAYLRHGWVNGKYEPYQVVPSPTRNENIKYLNQVRKSPANSRNAQNPTHHDTTTSFPCDRFCSLKNIKLSNGTTIRRCELCKSEAGLRKADDIKKTPRNQVTRNLYLLKQASLARHEKTNPIKISKTTALVQNLNKQKIIPSPALFQNKIAQKNLENLKKLLKNPSLTKTNSENKNPSEKARNSLKIVESSKKIQKENSTLRKKKRLDRIGNPLRFNFQMIIKLREGFKQEKVSVQTLFDLITCNLHIAKVVKRI